MIDRSVAALARECPPGQFELLALDDGSRDRTWDVIADGERRYPGIVRGMRHEKNQGIARTLEDLYKAATKEFVFDIAGDGQYPPEALHEMYPLLSEYDIVVCNRTTKQYTLYRQIISWCYRYGPKILFGVELYDSGSTKCRKKEIIQKIDVVSTSVFVEAERLIRAVKRGYRLTKVDIVQERRKEGLARGAKHSTVLASIRDMLMLWVRLEILRQRP